MGPQWIFRGPMLISVNNEWAIDQLRIFIESTQATRACDSPTRCVTHEAQIIAQAQIIEQIFEHAIPVWREDSKIKDRFLRVDQWAGHRDVAQRALAQLQREIELAENLGGAAPSLHATNMHPWVWDGARSRWESKHFRDAVSAAAIKVNAETQNKANRFDLSETKLFQEVFSLKEPELGKSRLRLMRNDKSDTYKSLHEGAIAFATGCYRAIRNPAAHVLLGELAEGEALEQLAAFSILARWVDTASIEEIS
jgi:uncharacterized protein Ymh